MKTVLQVTAILFIFSGVFFGITQIESIKEISDDVSYWKDQAEKNYSNNLIKAEYINLENKLNSSIVFTIATVLSGLISGIVFLALASIIHFLKELVEIEKSNKSESSN